MNYISCLSDKRQDNSSACQSKEQNGANIERIDPIYDSFDDQKYHSTASYKFYEPNLLRDNALSC